MRSFKRALIASVVLSWGAGFLAAAPISLPEIRVTLALPAQNVDFGDMDFRDENNRPIAAPQIRRRFEDIVNANLNRLLIENLTPLRRAFLDALASRRDVFADWLGKAVERAGRVLTIVTGNGSRVAPVVRSLSGWRLNLAPAGRATVDDSFVSLASLLISTTRLLR